MVEMKSFLVRPLIGSYEDSMVLTRSLESLFNCYGGGGKGGTKTVMVPATPPPAPPAEEATMVEFEDEEESKRTRTAMTQGAKSLQIPLGLGATSSVGTA